MPLLSVSVWHTVSMLDVTQIKGVGVAAQNMLHKLGIDSVEDLINNIPRKYDDYSHVTKVASIRPGPVTIKVKLKVSSGRGRYSKKGTHITEATAHDDTGSVRVMWFNQPYRANSIDQTKEYYLSGEYASNYRFLVITNPVCELVSKFPIHTARLVPQYRLTKGITSNQIRKYVKAAFDIHSPQETLPGWVLDEYDLISRNDALFGLHFPQTHELLQKSQKRIGFDELFELSLASEFNKQEFKKEHSLQIPFNKSAVQEFVDSLPFQLTGGQKRAAWDVLQDMTEGHPMNRLVEGDVGSGKTVVAAIAIVNTVAEGFQAALMAPTELLARQHAETLSDLLPESMADQIVFLSGSMSTAQKKTASEAIQNGNARIVIGTHALFQDSVAFKNLGLAIIDEQHRFGVKQRKQLQGKAKKMPHVLNMTATPIPRRLMLTVFGEMDVSVISELPKGRTPITTTLHVPEARQQLYTSLESVFESGHQAFVVCPMIEESEISVGRTMSVKSIHAQIAKWLPSRKIALLHGKLQSNEKEAIMKDFVAGVYDMVVSTTVIEVGVDVPNATHMIIEGADRFGLAQLHQLRGRVGRGSVAGYCQLITTDNNPPSKRLRYLTQESNGFAMAEYDLELRGPGAIYGTMQHGSLDLRVAKITDVELIQNAREAARKFISKQENLVEYKQLKARVDKNRVITNLN